jgi:MFS family permease
VIGGMVGAFTSKYVLDKMGRKKGILFHNLFSTLGSILALFSFFFKSPITLLFGRLFFGIQGGMSCALIPTYVNEISPANLRGQTGVLHQLLITFGILVS